jgi:hypothetical protein
MVREPAMTTELENIARRLGAIDAEIVRSAAEELGRLRAELRDLRETPQRTGTIHCQHPRGKLILTEVGMARQCDDCGYQDFTV